MTITVEQIKDKLPEWLKAVESGEPVFITRDGNTVARVVPPEPSRSTGPRFGTLKDRITVVDPDWARPQDDLDAWLAGDV